jgi:superfamily II DNA/RNA helicase
MPNRQIGLFSATFPVAVKTFKVGGRGRKGWKKDGRKFLF